MTQQRTLALLVLLMLAGFGLRVWGITAVDFRGDEAFTAQHWAMQPLSETLQNDATRDPHPPLAYAMFRAWAQVFGVSEFSLRVLPALLNMLGIPALYALGKRLDGRTWGFIAALLWTVHPFQIWHAQDARNYAIWAGFSSVALWLALRALDEQRPLDWLLYVIAALLAAYTYYLEAFMLVAINVYVLLAHWREWRTWTQWALSQIAIGGVMALWFLQPRLLSGGGYGGTTGGFQPEALLTWFLPTLTFGQVSLVRPVLGVALVALLLVALGLLARQAWRKALLLGLLLTIPMLLLGVVSTRLNVFTPRYVLATVPALLLLVAYLALRLPSRLLTGVFVAVWVSASLVSVWQEVQTPKAPNWSQLATYLQTRTTTDDLIIQTGVDPAFGYYYNVAEVPAPEVALPFTPQQPTKVITKYLDKIHPRYESLWIVGRTFPDWANAGVVEGWAEATLQQVRDTQLAGLPVRQYKTWQVAEDEISSAALTTFGGTIALVDVRVLPPEPNDTLTVWLYWQPRQRTEAPLTGFVHLLGVTNPATGSPLWAQDDHPPLGGLVSTTTWQPERIYRDVFTLNINDLPTGTYTLATGFYNPQTGARLRTAADDDSYALEQITVDE